MAEFSLRRVVALLVCVIVALAAGIVRAQTKHLPEAPGTWKPWKPFQAVASTRTDRRATPAEVKAFEAELLRLNDIARRAPGVASPTGFSVETWGNLAGYRVSAPGQPPGAAMPLAGGFTFGAFPIFEYERNGKTIREDTGETALLTMHVNLLESWVFGGKHVDEWGSVDTDAFLQPMPGVAIAGLPHYGDVLVVTNNPAPLWMPLALGDALDLVIASRQEVLASFEESLGQFKARLADLRDPAKRASRVEDAKAASVNMPDPAAFLAQMEEVARVEEASVVQEIGPTGGTGKGLIQAQRAHTEVTAWRAELSPADRGAPACYVANATGIRAAFRSGVGPGCVPIVRPNYLFFNKALPRSAPQVLVIAGIARCFDTANKYNIDANSPSPAGCAANRQLVETIDKDAVRAWLR